MATKVPTAKEIFRELKEVSVEIEKSKTIGDWLDLHTEADRLLDLYLDLGYCAVEYEYDRT